MVTAVALLAVVKAGAALLPLDPDHPRRRLGFVTADAGARLVLTAPGARQADWGVPVLEVEPTGPAHHRADDLEPVATPDNLLYVLYTSGSTGRPKGIAMHHVPQHDLMRWSTGVYAERPRVLHYFPITSDVGYFEFISAWASGGSVVITSEEERLDVTAVARLIREHRVTRVLLPVVALDQLAQHARAHPEDVASLREVATTGERQVITPAIRAMFERLPEAFLDNHYGSTEVNVVTAPRLTASATEWPELSGIGRPVSRSRIYVLDDDLAPVPIGVPGLLHVAGPPQARGYLGRPGITAASFLPDPFSGEPGARMYRMGDLGRWRADGTLEYLGRVDFQIKVRGHRVEPGEVESLLRGRADVRETVVTAVDRGDGNSLVAYIVADGGPPEPDELRDWLGRSLPTHMVPQHYVMLDAIPLSANGKVDRAALPAPELAAPAAAEPVTATEKAVAAVWSAVLSLPAVGVRDNFFGLGGHSLLLTQVVYRLREALGVEIPLQAVFEAPTVAELAALIDVLAAENAPELRPVDRQGELPLSYAQRRLWFLDQARPGSSAYNNMLALRVRGPLDLDAVAWALTRIEERHEAPRTSFPARDGRPYQAIAPPAPVRVELVDVSGEPAELREAAALAAFGEHQLRPFDLARGPLARYVVVRVADDEHILGLFLHHAISDTGSWTVFRREFAHFYQAFGSDPSPLDPVDLQYADYAAWQAALSDSGAFDDQLDYWARHLDGAPDAVDLPTDRPRSSDSESHGGGEHTFTIDDGLVARFEDLSREANATLFMTMLAAFSALLSRISGPGGDGGGDIVVGVPVSGRSDARVEPVIGLFINTLPLRVRCPREITFRALLQQVGETAVNAYRNQDVPLERIVERLRPHRDLLRNPLFQVLFQVQYDEPEDGEWIAGLAVEPFRGVTPPAKFDLSLNLQHGRGGMSGTFSFPTGLFDDATVRRIAARLRQLLAEVADDPDRPIGDLDLDTDDERHVLLAVGDTAREYPRVTVAELVDQQVARTPDTVAVECGDEQLSYRELDERATRVACELQAAGVGPGSVVAVAVPRSPGLVVALLAVAKAGGAHLRVELDQPGERIAYLLTDTAPALVLADSSTEAALSAVSPAPLLVLDTLTPAAATGTPRPAAPSDAAYVVYTSGSTGRPKGVVVSHLSITNQLLWFQDRYPMGSGDKVLMKTPGGFDVAVVELFGPLTSGATVVVAEPGGHRDPRYLAAVVRDREVTVAHFVPSSLRAFLHEPDAADCTSLRLVLCGGEPLPVDLAVECAAVLDNARLINLYGPAEAAVDVSSHDCAGEKGPDPVPIGTAVSNTSLRVLDADQLPVPFGAVGELCVGGAQVAWGYRGRPGHTAERFVPDPYSGEPGARIYRTGDLVRHRRDGALVFVGRADHQVKIRGMRVEPGETAAVITEHPDVLDAAVVARPDDRGEMSLVGYFVPAATAPRAADLTGFLRARLPSHMVPRALVVLDRLPLTANGKVDLAALPAAAPPRSAGGREARDDREEILCGVFADVLGLAEVAAEDSFFDLGGHSLLATRLVSRVRGVFGVEVSVQAVFEEPTPASLARRIGGAGAARARIGARTRPSRVPLSYPQWRLWFLNRFEPDSAAYNMPFALRLRGALDADALTAAVDDLVARHESLRTVFPQVDGEPHQVVTDVAGPVLRRLACDPGAEADVLAEFAAARFDLAGELPFRALLVSTSDAESTLLIVLHHIVCDGQSMTALIRDLSTAYAARCGGGLPEWSPLPVQYPDYALWQHDVLGAADDADSPIAEQTRYWTDALAGIPEEIALPVDRARPPTSDNSCGVVAFSVDRGAHEQVAAFARDNQASVFMVVHTALAALLTRLGAGDDIPIGTPVAGRGDEVLDDIVGFFVNTLVLRTDTSGNPSLRELLARVRETDLAAFGNQDVPFERVVEVVNPARSLARHPLFQVMLAAQGDIDDVPELAGLEVSRRPVGVGVTKFDLTLHYTQESGGDGKPAGLRCILEYRADLFDHATAETFADRFKRLLDGLLTHPDRGIGDVDVLHPAERHRVVARWNDTAVDHGRTRLVHEVFTEHAASTPHALAVVHDGTALTYAEVDEAANRLAHWLIARGAGPERVVALAVPRSADYVVAVLAVLKAGAAYLPVDAGEPADRVRMMLADSGPVVVLDSARPDGVEEAPATDPAVALSPSNAAYVIYTSGSTGRPKGVVVEHRGLANQLRVHESALFGPAAASRRMRVTLAGPFSFDTSWDGLVAMFTGHELHVLSERVRQDAREFVAYLDRHRVDVVGVTPSLAERLIEAGLLRGAHRPAIVAVGGEAVGGAVWDALRAAGPEVRALNHYGPTEATVWALSASLADSERPLIGRPMSNVRCYVLDEALRPVPVGVVGELCLGGVQVSRGYVNQQATTAERFVPDPFAPGGGRLYRTGDLVRWTADGRIDFIGRGDDQVKLRGFRIEPGEIAAVLETFPEVAGAVAAVVPPNAVDPHLVAYVVPAPGSWPSPDRLLARLADKLPAHMVPSAVVVMDALPLNARGKVDRAALPVPEAAVREGRSARTPTEVAIGVRFAEVLGLPEVGAEQSFFELGGHSLLATKLATRLSDDLGVPVSVRTLFAAPTVAGLARALEGEVAALGFAPVLPLRSTGSAAPLFCVHTAAGFAWCYHDLLSLVGRDLPVYGLQTPGLADATRTPGSLSELADAHIDNVLAIQPEGPYRLLGWSFGGVVAHEMAVRLRDRGHQVELLALMDPLPAEQSVADDELDVDGALRRVVEVLGYDAGAVGGRWTSTAAAAWLRDRPGPLAGLSADALDNLVEVYFRHSALREAHCTRRFDGDLVLFTATGDKPAGFSLAEAWRAHAGRVVEYELDCGHDAMSQPEPFARIAGEITRRLSPGS